MATPADGPEAHGKFVLAARGAAEDRLRGRRGASGM